MDRAKIQNAECSQVASLAALWILLHKLTKVVPRGRTVTIHTSVKIGLPHNLWRG
jgi:hypothetical protein